MKTFKIRIFATLALLMSLASCQDKFDEFQINPNVAGEVAAVPPSYMLGRVLFEIFNGGGRSDGRQGNVYEGPWDQLMRWNQYVVGNNNNYGGSNFYIWTASATMYNQIKNLDKMEEQAFKSLGTRENSYAAISKFLKAYSFIWLTQRVGDIPMTEAGKGLENLTPKFDTQKDVYVQCLQLLEEANTDLTNIIPKVTAATNIEGDIYFNNDLKLWQRAVNSYTLRVLISLSKRADDTPELGIKQKFANIISNPTKYPILRSNADNVSFKFNQQYNPYPTYPYISLYANQVSMGKTYLDLTTSVKDPRTFVVATPAPAQLASGKTISDFTAYVGADGAIPQTTLITDALAGKHSFVNYNRYYAISVLASPPEPYVIIGYSEMNFNIAEAINKGWLTGNADTYYTNGIKASLDFYGLKDGNTLQVGESFGKLYPGTITVSVTNFLTDTGVVYKGNNADGLKQILQQKYVAMFQNSGWEAFYNQRRTGVPTFTEGAGTNSLQKIPKRWRYPGDEMNNNSVNTNEALQSQYGGNDDLYGLMWMIK